MKVNKERVLMEQGQNVVGEQGANGMTGEGMPSGVSASAPEPSRTENMMTTAAPEMPQMSGAVEKPKKKNNAMMLTMILLVIAAAGGIGFGIWAMLDGNQQVDNLNKQVANLQQQNNELQAQISDTPEVEGDTIINIDTDSSNVDTADYIYVGEWGLKIKIPNDLKYVSYKFDIRATEEGQFLYINGLKSDSQSVPSFVNSSTVDSWLAALSRYPIDYFETYTVGSVGELVYTDGEYNYYASGPQAVQSLNEEDVALETQTESVLIDMLKNKENYSKI